jgi:glycosyltransferase involved in cell wall biosynthesis
MVIPTIEQYLEQIQGYSTERQGGKSPITTLECLPSGTPLITVITVVFNAEISLEETLQSVFTQNYPYLEYIIIDGGSTDKTLEIVEKYDSKLSHWRSEPDLGLYDAMNKGIALSHGQLICLLNAGDRQEPHTLEMLVKAWQSTSKPTIFVGHCRTLKENSSASRIEFVRPQQLPAKMLPHASVFVSRDVYQKWGLFDLRFRIASDFDFLCRCYANQVSFELIDSVLTTVEPRGVSGNYYANELESTQIRLRHRLIAPVKILKLGIYSLITITIHHILEFLGLWNWVEERKYASSR